MLMDHRVLCIAVDERQFVGFNLDAVSMAITNYSEEKLQQTILYFLEHINNVHLGRTKLMKLLYFVDFNHFETHGKSVTGATYRKLPHGPYPDKVVNPRRDIGGFAQVVSSTASSTPNSQFAGRAAAGDQPVELSAGGMSAGSVRGPAVVARA